MTKQLYLLQLLKVSKNTELVKFVDELIADRVEDGENEMQVIGCP